jgi:hypothetical protein
MEKHSDHRQTLWLCHNLTDRMMIGYLNPENERWRKQETYFPIPYSFPAGVVLVINEVPV